MLGLTSGQLGDHIGWAKSMPFALCNPTNPRTNPVNFHKKYWELAILKNDLFLSRPFWFFFFKNDNIFFASSPWKLVTNYVLEWMGVNFYDYDDLQPKITPPKHFSRQCNEPKWFLFLKTHRLESQVHIKLIKRCPTPNSTKVDHPVGGTSVQGCYDFVSIWFFSLRL